jgi:hypothetical protein
MRPTCRQDWHTTTPGGRFSVVLIRLYAYAVAPQKGEVDPSPPVGGALTDLEPLGDVVQRATSQAPAGSWLEVNLNVDRRDPARTHPVRNAAIQLAFDEPAEANAAADALALRLSVAMDRRMRGGCLLAIALEEIGRGNEVTLWTFPREDALRFLAGRGRPSVEVLEDVFSQRSNLRKAAVLRGADAGVTSFLTARVADLQTGGRSDTADYCIDDFLDASLSLSAGTGSIALARALKTAWDSAPSEEARDEYYAAAVAVRASRPARTSLTTFANTYLSGPAKARFLQTKEAREHRARQFRLDVSAFDRIAQVRVLRTDNGLRISAPFATANTVLEFHPIDGGLGRQVVARGTIVEDKVAARA